jgi:hypothetical protein
MFQLCTYSWDILQAYTEIVLTQTEKKFVFITNNQRTFISQEYLFVLYIYSYMFRHLYVIIMEFYIYVLLNYINS